MQSFITRVGSLALVASLLGLPAAFDTLAASDVQVAKATIIHGATPHDRLYDIEFVGSRGWAIGDFGVILRSDDGGVTWEYLEGLGDDSLLAVDFIDKQRGVVVGIMGVAYYTEDGGDSWSKSTIDYSGRTFNVKLTESGFGIAVGEFGAILRTQDLGHSWSEISPDYQELMNQFYDPHLYDVNIDSQGVIMVFGEFNTILRSRDHGDSWEVLRKGDSDAVVAAEDAGDIDAIGVESLFSAHFNNDQQGWTTGQGGLILETSDGGDTWSKISTPIEALLMDIWISQEGEGVAIGMRSFIRTKDFGKTWYALKGDPVTGWWYQALAMGENTIHIEGSEGVEGRSATPSMTTLSSPVYAVGYSGLIIRLDE